MELNQHLPNWSSKFVQWFEWTRGHHNNSMYGETFTHPTRLFFWKIIETRVHATIVTCRNTLFCCVCMCFFFLKYHGYLYSLGSVIHKGLRDTLSSMTSPWKSWYPWNSRGINPSLPVWRTWEILQREFLFFLKQLICFFTLRVVRGIFFSFFLLR